MTVIELVELLQRLHQLAPVSGLDSEFLQLDAVLDGPQQGVDTGQAVRTAEQDRAIRQWASGPSSPGVDTGQYDEF